MSGPVVLDAEAFSSLAGRATPREREVRAAMRAADRLGCDVVVPTVILAELYRGRWHGQLVDSCLSRETGVRTRDTDRRLARLIGGILAGADAGSDHLADAHVVAVAVEMGGGLILTGDESDLQRRAVSEHSGRAAALSWSGFSVARRRPPDVATERAMLRNIRTLVAA